MRANIILFWLVVFLGLGTLSALGAASLFPLPLGIVIAITVAGLGSALAFQFRSTGNLLFLLVAGAMILVASFLDGVSVWEMLNQRQNSGVAEALAEVSVATRIKGEAESRVSDLREQIALLVREATDMDNDGEAGNDHLIAGQLALIESKKADLANLETQAGVARASVASISATAAGREAGTHYFLQTASAQADPAKWLILRASAFFLPLEFALALLAWSLQGVNGETGTPASVPVPPAPRPGRPGVKPGAPVSLFPTARQEPENLHFRNLNLNQLRQHLRLLRREGVIPRHRISSEGIGLLNRAEALALCQEYGAVVSPLLPLGNLTVASSASTRAVA